MYTLLDVFQDTREEIYQDRAHVNELGNEIIARRVADLIAGVWGWPRKRLQQCRSQKARETDHLDSGVQYAKALISVKSRHRKKE